MMPYIFKLPDIGDGLTEADIVRWRVEVGRPVEADEVLVEVETAKAVVEIPSPAEGTVLHHGADEGQTLPVGEVLAVIGGPDEV
ncbi:MAG: 2-oxo acid dehydrogenase subunit E2, partial [Acidimicrobiia bacterium]|nr:2-oxo acid dehydrogenase subunit E2 [Acidimicrobiia bacterium]